MRRSSIWRASASILGSLTTDAGPTVVVGRQVAVLPGGLAQLLLLLRHLLAVLLSEPLELSPMVGCQFVLLRGQPLEILEELLLVAH